MRIWFGLIAIVLAIVGFSVINENVVNARHVASDDESAFCEALRRAGTGEIGTAEWGRKLESYRDRCSRRDHSANWTKPLRLGVLAGGIALGLGIMLPAFRRRTEGKAA